MSCVFILHVLAALIVVELVASWGRAVAEWFRFMVTLLGHCDCDSNFMDVASSY